MFEIQYRILFSPFSICECVCIYGYPYILYIYQIYSRKRILFCVFASIHVQYYVSFFLFFQLIKYLMDITSHVQAFQVLQPEDYYQIYHVLNHQFHVNVLYVPILCVQILHPFLFLPCIHMRDVFRDKIFYNIYMCICIFFLNKITKSYSYIRTYLQHP